MTTRQEHRRPSPSAATAAAQSSSPSTAVPPSAKRARQESLAFLCSRGQWAAALERVGSHPSEASETNRQGATPLALACRHGAPAFCTAALLQASPQQLRRLLPSRGTPLHEAIVCERVGIDVIRLLLETDERLELQQQPPSSLQVLSSPLQVLSSRRAAMLQDVDGHTPLHLLIRRRSHIVVVAQQCPSPSMVGTPPPLPQQEQQPSPQPQEDHWMTLLELLVRSCPDAVGIPDRGEYEEPPLVMALKASLYAEPEYNNGNNGPGDDMDGGSNSNNSSSNTGSSNTASGSSSNNNASSSTEYMYPRMERRIHEMVHIMLQHFPSAAFKVLTGARGQYTALHSAVFHGRCSDTIRLLLEADKKVNNNNNNTTTNASAALLANTQGELPLHFAAMRGEPPRSIAVLGDAAPRAVLQRDVSGLCPLHWLWIRYVSTLLSLEDRTEAGSLQAEMPHLQVVVIETEQHELDAVDNDNNNTCVASSPAPFSSSFNKYTQFWNLERGEFFADLMLIRKLDPPVDFLRMRHIPPELWEYYVMKSTARWAERAVDRLARVKERILDNRRREQQQQQQQSSDTTSSNGTRPDNDADDEMGTSGSTDRADPHEDSDKSPDKQLRGNVWTRQEAVTCLFWVKTVSLMRSAAKTIQDSNNTDNYFSLVHTVFSLRTCPPAVAHLACLLFPDELSKRDHRGRLPLHLAAGRDWNTWDWRTAEGDSASNQVLKGESLKLLKTALELSPAFATRVTDHNGKLVLHHAIDVLVKTCSKHCMVSDYNIVMEPLLHVLSVIVQRYPDALERRDGTTKLYPFLQATAVATQCKTLPAPTSGYHTAAADELPLSIVYQLLRANPSLVQSGIPATANTTSATTTTTTAKEDMEVKD